MINIHFCKALDHAIFNMQNYLHNFKEPDVYLRKNKHVQISIVGLFAKNLQKFLCKTCAIRFLIS